jgi:alkylation response protein AidB-like acyl-CoA dehydrogenase
MSMIQVQRAGVCVWVSGSHMLSVSKSVFCPAPCQSMVHAQRRETFGKKLIEHPVIRNKLAHMARHVEATHALIESVAFQSIKMTHDEKLARLPGLISILKVQCTMTFELCAREASQVCPAT